MGTDEDHVLFDIESEPKYENKNPGTVTIEGFAMECWDYEETFGKNRVHTYFMDHSKMPSIDAKQLLRRLDELRRDAEKFGWNPDQDDANLFEFTGDLG